MLLSQHKLTLINRLRRGVAYTQRSTLAHPQVTGWKMSGVWLWLWLWVCGSCTSMSVSFCWLRLYRKLILAFWKFNMTQTWIFKREPSIQDMTYDHRFQIIYDIKEELEKGTFSIILKRCIHKSTGLEFAAKIINILPRKLGVVLRTDWAQRMEY